MIIPDPLTLDSAGEAGIDTRRVRVLLNYNEVMHVVEASEKDGYVVRYIKDLDGGFYRDGHEIATERLEGNVKILIEGGVHNYVDITNSSV